MQASPTTQRRIVAFGWAMAAFGTVFGQLHALSRIASHPEDLEYPLTRAWAVPAMDLFRPLLDWGDPIFVYWTFGKMWFPVFVALTLTAFLVHQSRRPAGFEKLAWRVMLTGLLIATVSVFGDYYTPWTDEFFVVGLPGLLLTGLGSTALGITLLRKGFRPRLTGWLLVAFVPLFFAITEVTSMGNVILPLAWAWALAAHHTQRASADEAAAAPATSAA